MSRVSNVILSFNILENIPDRIRDVNCFLADFHQAFPPEIWDRSDWHGGGKHLEQPVFVAAFNHVPASAILKAVGAVKWKEPEDVRVFFCGQDNDAFEQIWPNK